MNIHKKIPIPLYGGVLHIIYCDSKGYDNVMNNPRYIRVDAEPDFEYEDISALTFIRLYQERTTFFVFFRNDLQLTINTISHESLHTMHYIFQSRCVDYDMHNDEHAAYLLGWVTQTIHDSLKKYIE